MTSKLPYCKQKLFEGMSLAGKQASYQLSKGFCMIGMWAGLKIKTKKDAFLVSLSRWRNETEENLTLNKRNSGFTKSSKYMVSGAWSQSAMDLQSTVRNRVSRSYFSKAQNRVSHTKQSQHYGSLNCYHKLLQNVWAIPRLIPVISL